MLRLTGVLWILFLADAASPATARLRTLTVEEAIQLAVERNPDVQLSERNIDAARARLTGASLLLQTNPTLTGMVGPRSSDMGRSLDYSVELLQQFEIGGQRGARIDAAEAALYAAQAQAEALRTDTAARVREGFGRALAAEQRMALAFEAFSLATEGVGAAEERFRAGAAPLIEVNTARVEIGRAARGRGEAQRRHAEAIADLHLLLGLDPSEELALRGEAASQELLAEPAQLVQEALENRGDLLAGRHALESARAEARLAARESIPSPRIGASLAREEETEATIVQGVAMFDVPIFNRNQMARGVTTSRIGQMETSLQATELRIRQEVLTSLARLQAARAAADAYASDVVRAMNENVELVTESYRAGKIDFLQLLLIRRQTLDAQREHIDVLEELNAARAQLNRALGRVL